MTDLQNERDLDKGDHVAMRKRLQVVEALLFVTGDDEVFATICSSRTYKAAADYLAGLGMAREQITAVLAMPLSDRIQSSHYRLLHEAADIRQQIQ